MGFGNPMEVLGTVVIIEYLTGLGKQGWDVFPYPLGPITDDAQTYLLFRNQASLFDLFEGLAELRLILHLMPTQHMHDTLAIKQIEAKALGVAPLPPPPRPFGPRVSWPPLGLSGTVGTRRHIGSINAQHHHRTAQATRGHRGKAPLDLLARWCHLQYRQARGHLVSHSVQPFAPKRHARQIVKERLGRVIGDFGDQIYRGLVGYALKAGQLTYDCRYSTMHGMPVTGGRGFRGLKPLWDNGVPP